MENLKNIAPLADFDWDAFESGAAAEVDKKAAEAAYDETLNHVHEHEVTDGTRNIIKTIIWEEY